MKKEERKTDVIKRFLDEAREHYLANDLQMTLEKLIVAESLTREIIVKVRRDYYRQTEGISVDKISNHAPKHVMWYELKYKYLSTQSGDKQ